MLGFGVVIMWTERRGWTGAGAGADVSGLLTASLEGDSLTSGL